MITSLLSTKCQLCFSKETYYLDRKKNIFFDDCALILQIYYKNKKIWSSRTSTVLPISFASKVNI